MKKFLVLFLVIIGITNIYGISLDTKQNNSTIYNPFKPDPQQSKWYYGGNIGINFWNNYFYIGVYPLVGYKVTPKFSVGGKLGYAYYSYNDSDFSTHNYGGSIFTRYRVVPQFYLHGEFVYFSYERQTFVNLQRGTERFWVPFLLLGGGYSQMVSPNVWVFVEVLFDVIQDSNSPYKDWDPFVSFGAGVGF
jgi:hypothetical protein